MYFSKIKIKHIYNVQFDPVELCEFNKKHLALVLKKNSYDKNTVIVMPLTNEPRGDGINKIDIGFIDSLPSSLKGNKTYAVLNQIRTVNVSRFTSLKEGDNAIETQIDNELFLKLLGLGMNDMTYNLDFDERIELFKKQYEQACISKVIDLAYNILKIKKEVNVLIKDNPENPLINEKNNEIECIRNQIRDIFKDNIEYTLNENQIKSGIDKILKDILG